MSTYRQRIAVQDKARALEAIQKEKDKAESARLMSLSAEECYHEGYSRGVEDGRDSYHGALNRITTLGDNYAYPDSYRQGYIRGHQESSEKV